MPTKKKKGKASKLARMSDEERARYLQHRADVELEAKRRKQQLIAAFAKNKLRREEAFTRINTAKLNEQWRASLRRIKCSELKDCVKHLWREFEELLKRKDDFVRRMYDELLEADLDHRRFQEAHMACLDDIIDKGKERVDYLRRNYEESIQRIEIVEIEHLRKHRLEMKESLVNLKTIIFAKSKHLEEELAELRTKNAVNLHNLVFSKEESLLKLKQRMHPKMESLWRQLNEAIANYERTTESKRKQYEYLKEQDDQHRAESARFPRRHAELKRSVEHWKRSLVQLALDREETIDELRLQADLLIKQVGRMRQDIKSAQNLDALQLKRLSVLSSEAITELERVMDKVTEIQTMAQLCSELEPVTLKVKKYSLKNFELAKDLLKIKDEPFGFLKKIEGFRDHLYCVIEENNLLKRERLGLAEENDRLKHSLRAYLITVTRVPTIRPRTRA
ncbi:coiled-coil domain-containing protein 65 [Trichogramma pretiosum]|uniref:coiled-coil domain-containing protein 65 n=1 Tax=Trichogramma pretiosum TaxID=7493 RepID=UPI0006C9B84A|nr:coiled-coil domain-containing protein 65 [Trichogramma pretiosum]